MSQPIPATPVLAPSVEVPRVRCFRRSDGQTIEGCDRIRFRSHGTCEMVYRDDTFSVLPMSLCEAEQAVRRGIWVEVEDEPLGTNAIALRKQAFLARIADARRVEDELFETFSLARSTKTSSESTEAFRRLHNARTARLALEADLAKMGGGS